MALPPVEHIKQRGPTCLFAAAAMPCGKDQKTFDSEVLTLGKALSFGGATVTDILPYLMIHGLIPGPIPTFSVNPVKNKQDVETIKINKHLYEVFCQLATRQDFDPVQFIEDKLGKKLVDNGIKIEAVSGLSEDNGLHDQVVGPGGIESFLVEVKIDQPAIVAVNTGENMEAGHAVYWSGEKLYDPDCDGAKDNFEGYSIRAWMPLTKVDDQTLAVLELLERKKRTLMKALMDKKMSGLTKNANRKEQAITIKIARGCLVEDIEGHRNKSKPGDLCRVDYGTALMLIRDGQAEFVPDE